MFATFFRKTSSAFDQAYLAESKLLLFGPPGGKYSNVNTNETPLKKKIKKALKPAQLKINVSYCHYPALKEIAVEQKFKLTKVEDDDWDIYWSDMAIHEDRLKKMEPY